MSARQLGKLCKLSGKAEHVGDRGSPVPSEDVLLCNTLFRFLHGVTSGAQEKVPAQRFMFGPAVG